jgi:4-hydroxy-tetrahydrodipicolinate synthase
MPTIPLLCRMATTFTPDHELDEDAFEQLLQRFIDADLGVYIGSGGSGEGHALTDGELSRIYEIGVAVGKGRIAVNANPPEKHTVAQTVHQARLAVAAGVEVINVYGPTMSHGYRPTDEEIVAYFEGILHEVGAPIAIAPNPVLGYSPSARVMAGIADRNPNVVAINLAGLGNAYFVSLMDALHREVPVYVPFDGSLYTLPLGATGLLSAEANILPRTLRRYLDLHEQGGTKQLVAVYADLQRFHTFAKRWYGATPRWIKLAMRLLDLPGGAGGPRPPYLWPPDAQVRRFARELLELHIPEIDELAAAAGLTEQSVTAEQEKP